MRRTAVLVLMLGLVAWVGGKSGGGSAPAASGGGKKGGHRGGNQDRGRGGNIDKTGRPGRHHGGFLSGSSRADRAAARSARDEADDLRN